MMIALDMRNSVFDDVHTKAMGDAFDAICTKLLDACYPIRQRYPARMSEVIAGRVIAIAGVSPERDPERLAALVLASLGLTL